MEAAPRHPAAAQPGTPPHGEEEATQRLEQRLQEVRAKRGYLLPHHGLMALAFPALLAAYDAAYTELALADRVLSHHDREWVWLAVLAATDEALATHHVAKFRASGGTDQGIGQSFAACAWALGGEAHLFAARAWPRQLAPWDPRAAYLDGLRRFQPMRLVHLAGCAVQVCRARWPLLEWHLEAAYEDGVPEDEIAEAISIPMFPGSVPRFVEACGVWRRMVLDGRLPASDRYKAWARLSGQGGYDEAWGAAEAGSS